MERRAARRAAAIGGHIRGSPSSGAGAATPPHNSRLLAGVRVLELATVVAAPSACAILADLGADVLKIENAAAPDYVRAFSKRDDPAHTADPARLAEEDGFVGTGFTQFNRGKRAMALNYSTPAGRAILMQLLAEADVLVTNVRLKGLRNAGLDYDSLKDEFPSLVFAHLSAWGLTGPRQDDPGYDIGAFFAYTGMMELSRSSDEAPLPRMPPAYGDLLTGGQLVAGIALALLHKKDTGQGQLVDVSLLRAGVWAMSHVLTSHAANNPFAAGPSPAIRGTRVLGERKSMITDGTFGKLTSNLSAHIMWFTGSMLTACCLGLQCARTVDG